MGPAELQHHLDILAVKRGFDGKVVRAVALYQRANFGKNGLQFFKMVLLFPQIHHSHVHIMRLALVGKHHSETEYVGPGVYSHDDSLSCVFHRT